MLEPPSKGPILLPPEKGPMLLPPEKGPKPLLPKPLLLLCINADADVAATTVAIATACTNVFIVISIYLVIKKRKEYQ
jgi:hypothetical protein